MGGDHSFFFWEGGFCVELHSFRRSDFFFHFEEESVLIMGGGATSYSCNK